MGAEYMGSLNRATAQGRAPKEKRKSLSFIFHIKEL